VTVLVKEQEIKLSVALKVADLSKTAYYYESKPENDKRKKLLDPVLAAELKKIEKYETVYGYRKITKKFAVYNHKKVYRHMKVLKMLQPKKLKKHKTKRLPIECPIESNIRWEGDLTYVYDGEQMNYLFCIDDVFDKEVIGDYYGLRCRADEAILSLEEAVKTRFGSLEPCSYYRVSLRLDQGSQYISKKFKKRAKELGIKIDYCGIDCPDDKPYIECFFSRYKCEEVYRNEYRGFSQAFLGWVSYKSWYNKSRIHQGLNYMTIPEFKQSRVSHVH
jgi:putative transposase